MGTRIQSYEEAAKAIRTGEGAERLGEFCLMDTELLLDIITGTVNAKAVAAAVLQGMGKGFSQEWVGAQQADNIWKAVEANGGLK